MCDYLNIHLIVKIEIFHIMSYFKQIKGKKATYIINAVKLVSHKGD